jgi:hypothetical protein
VAVPLAAAEDTKPASIHARMVAPFLEDRTVAVLHLDLSKFEAEAVIDLVKSLAKLGPINEAEMRKQVREILAPLHDAKVGDIYIVFSLADLPENPPFAVVPVPRGGDAEAVRKALQESNLASGEVKLDTIGSNILLSSEAVLKRLRDLKAVERPEVAQAFTAAGDGAAQLVLVATTDTRRIVEEFMPKLPEALGGGSIKVLTRGLQWIALRADAPPKMNLKVIAQASDPPSAKALHVLVGKAFKVAADNKPLREALPDFDKAVKLLTPKVEEDQLTLALDGKEFVELLRPPVARVQDAAARVMSTNNLKQLVLAMHNYHDVNGRLPGYANADKDGKPLLSWRVHLLPYLEQDALYKEFKLDEPWDSEHNKKLIPRMPVFYNSTKDPALALAGKTTYVVPTGKDTVFPDTKGMKISDITDGTSNTIIILDVSDQNATIWTRPDDFKIDPKDPLKGLALRFGPSFLCAFADGSVHSITKEVKKETLKALITPRGNEPVTLP